MMLNHLFISLHKPTKWRITVIGKIILLAGFLFFYQSGLFAQSVTTITVDFSSNKDTSVTISNVTRNGNACGGNNCIVFKVILNAGSDQLSFDVDGAGAFGSATYQVNCGPTNSLAVPVCITGLSTANVTFCKPGNNANSYTISASSLVKGSADLTLRQNCSGVMSVTGLQSASATWTSIFPGTEGQYNNYLSCLSNCTSTVVTPQAGSPAYIDYKVSGSTSCTGARSDTIRVYTRPALTVPITPADPAICSGTSTLLTASPVGGNPPYSYSWSSGQSTSAISVGIAGTYTVTVSDNTTGCAPISQSTTVIAVASPAAPTASGASICAGNTATLTAVAPGGIYQWYDAVSGGNLLFTGASYTTPVLTATTNYYVQTTVSGCNSSRTMVTVTVIPVPTAPVTSSAIICSGNTAVLSATAPGGIYQWYDAISGGTLLQTGSNYTTPVLNTTTNYYLQTIVSGCTSSRASVTVTVVPIPAAPAASNTSICSNNQTMLSTTSLGGIYQWYDAASGGNLLASGTSYTTPVLSATTSYYLQTTISGCTSNRTVVTVTVNPIPATPTASATTVCAGNTALATVTSTTAGATYEWYDAASGGNLLASGTNYTTPVLSNDANYYVQTSLAGCNSNRKTVGITVIPLPTNPTVPSVFICSGNTAVLTATAPGGTYQWYDAASGGNLLASDPNYTTPVLNNTTQYYVQTSISGCAGLRTQVAVQVTPAPATPTVLSGAVCAGNSASLTATAPGGTYQWYDAASGGNLLLTGPNYITPLLNSSITYYVQSTIAGCTGRRTAVTTTVIPAPDAPTATGASICAGSGTTLIASAPGGNYQWYDAASGGNLLHTGAVYTTSALTNTTVFYVQTTLGSCTGQRTGITVTINPIPAMPTSSGETICAGNAVTLAADGPAGIYQWYDAPFGGNLLHTGTAYLTPVLNNTTVHYVQTSLAGCTSARASVTTTVLPIQQPAFNYPSGTFCVSGSNVTPVIINENGGIFSATPAGLIFVNTSTGEIDIAASALGTYTIQFITGGPCIYSSSAQVTITNSPNASFIYSGPYCPQQLTAQPIFSSGASAGIFTTPSAGLVFMSTSTGEINLQKSTPGTYTITNNIAASAGCAATAAVSTVTILPLPSAKAGTNQTVCAGSTITLNGSIGGTATTGRWSGGTGSFTDASQLTTQYKPADGESMVKLYLTTDDPPGQCIAATDSIILLINLLPAPPVVQNMSICTGNTATLTATSPGGIYEWHNSSSGGTAIAVGSSFTTPILSADNLYYVQSTINGCTGPRTLATVSVSAKPFILNAPTGEVCSANPFTYSITGNETGIIYTWSRTTVAGITNPSSNGQTNSIITEVLNSTSNNIIPVTYSILPLKKGCTGDPFFYTVFVKPTPVAPAITNSSPVCAGTPLNLFTNAITDATYRWSGPNGFSSTQQNPVLANVNIASAGIYELTVTVNNCSSSPSAKNIAPVIAAPAAASNSPLCEQSTLQLTAGGLVGATYSWKGPSGFSSLSQNPSLTSVSIANAGIYYVTASIAGCVGLTDSTTVNINIPPSSPQIASNSPVCTKDSITFNVLGISSSVNFQWSGPGGFRSASPSPLIPTAEKANEGTYNLTVSAPGCAITSASSIAVVVNQKPEISTISNNSPICEGDTLILHATSLPGAGFSWSSKSGYNSLLQNPALYNVTKTNETKYHVVASLNGCSSDTATTAVSIVKTSVANAGADRTICANNASVMLSGNITGEDTRSGIWTSDGSGSFLPAATQLSAVYVPGQADTAKRKVILTLKTVDNKVCPVSISSAELNITPAPWSYAGQDKAVCSNDSLINLYGEIINARGGIWSSSGSGNFLQTTSSLAKTYIPSREDIQKGNIRFYLTSTGNGNCLAVSDTVHYSILPIPFVDAGNDLTIFENETIHLTPQVKGNDLQFLWSPPFNLNNDTARNPLLTGKSNQEYTVRVTGTGSCIVEDKLFVKVLKPFIIPNIFTPNADGVHDVWSIPELNNYPGAIVEIFTRSGMKIFSSVGYGRPWDGTYNGKPVPVATYYYIIKPNFRNLLFSGSVTIAR
jgi:gliding motility-associated-like protein